MHPVCGYRPLAGCLNQPWGGGGRSGLPSNRTRKIVIPHDAGAYKHRNRIERCFNRLRHFRRFDTRYDRRTIHFTGFVHLAAAMIWMR
jgi:transposase